MSPFLNAKLKKALKLKASHMLIIGIALTISISLISTQRFFNTSINQTLLEKSAELLTADIEIASTKPLEQSKIDQIDSRLPSHAKSQRQLFSSMIQYYGNQTRLAEIVAIQKNYPLRGNCIGMDEDGNLTSISKLLQSTENAVVISDQLYNETNITFGSSITIGDFKGIVVGLIHSEPDISVQSLRFGPRVYMAIKNVKKTGFNQQLSRNYHSLFVRFHTPEIADQWVESLTKALGIEGNRKTIQGSYGPSQPIVVRSFRDVNTSILRGFSSINQFFLFLSLFILLLTATAFGFIIWSSIIQKLNDIGNLRYLGLSNSHIHQFYKKQTLIISTLSTVIGIGFGLTFAQLCHWFIGQQINIPFQWITVQAIDILFIAGFAILGCYTMILIVLKITSTNHVFNVEQPKKLSLGIIIAISLIILGFITVFLALNNTPARHILWILALFLVIFIILGTLDTAIFSSLKKLPIKKLSFSYTFAITYLSRGHTIRRMAFISISLSIIAMLSIANYEASLNKEFNPNASDRTLPSLFVMDLYKSQKDEFKSIISSKHDLSPMIRTRIYKINNQSLNEYKKERPIKDDYFLHREQNLSTRAELYPSETIIKGTWFKPKNEIIEISIEERFAKRLKLDLNDQIEFYFLNQPLRGIITSIRSVDWSTFKPNFFMLIEPPYLDQYPQTWISSIYTKSKQEHRTLQTKLSSNFPNISILDIQNTSQKVMSFFKTFIMAFNLGSVFCFLIGTVLFILLGKLYSDIRKDAYNMLHWIGCSKRQIYQISLIENLCFSTLTYLCALGISLGISFILFNTIIPIPLVIHWWANGIVFVVLTLIVIGQWALQKKTQINDPI